MCYERRRAEACVDESAHHALVIDPQHCCLGSCQLLVCDDIPAAVKCASVSRWACRKRRCKNLPCMRVDVDTMAGRKEMF